MQEKLLEVLLSSVKAVPVIHTQVFILCKCCKGFMSVQTLLFSYSCRRYNCLTLNMVCSLVCLDCEITHLAAKVAVFLRKQKFLSLTHLGSDVLVQ